MKEKIKKIRKKRKKIPVLHHKRTQKKTNLSKSFIFTSVSERKKPHEPSLLEQYTCPQTEEKQESRAMPSS